MRSKRKRRNSKLSTPSLANLSEYCKPQQYEKRFVNGTLSLRKKWVIDTMNSQSECGSKPSIRFRLLL